MTDAEPWQLVGPSGARAELLLLEQAESGWPSEWAALIRSAEEQLAAQRLTAARELQERAWRVAYDRATQGATLHHIGRRWWVGGDEYAAAAHFELARALRRGFVAAELTANTERALQALRAEAGFDAIVLTGGAGRRMLRAAGRGPGQAELGYGGKAEIPLVGWPMVDHVLLAISLARRRIVVGPERRGLAEPVFCRENPPGSGPVAAIAAAAELVTAPETVVLAGDLPFIASGLAELHSALTAGSDAAALVDLSGRINYLAAWWRSDALRRSLATLGTATGAPVRTLFEHARVTTVPDFDAAAADCDTIADLRLAELRVRQAAAPRKDRSWAPLPAAPLAWPGLELHAPS